MTVHDEPAHLRDEAAELWRWARALPSDAQAHPLQSADRLDAAADALEAQLRTQPHRFPSGWGEGAGGTDAAPEQS